MRRLRNRGPSGAELTRQTQVRRLLCKYGAYSRNVASKSCCQLEWSTAEAASAASKRSSKLDASSIELSSARSRRVGKVLHEDDDLKLTYTRPSQLLPANLAGQPMDKGLALAAAQYVSRVLSDGSVSGVDAQRLKEDFLHQLERDWGFAGPENLSVGRVKITIKRRDNDLDNIRRVAELERATLEKNRLMEEKGVQLRNRVEAVASSQHVSSSTKVVKTRVVKTVKRTVQTVRTA